MENKRGIRQSTVVAVLCLAALCAQAKSPENKGTLDGRLTDWHSVPLAEAVVVVRNLSTGETTRGVTGKNGSYRFTGLGPGEYRMEAEAPQLGRGAVEGILVSAGHATRVQAALVMELPSPPLAPEITVHELDPVTPAVTTMIAGEELGAIPIATRNWQEFAAITPAANPEQQGSGSQIEGEDEPESESLSLEGASADRTASSIDGMESTAAFHAPGGSKSRSQAVGESAVLSMQARTGNSPADQGRAVGGAIRVTTNRGGSGLHGQVFYLDRQSLFGARNPFTQWVQQSAPASGVDIAQFTAQPYSPVRSRQTFGIGIGSEIWRKKLFWFAALDGLLDDDPAVATVRHPGNFFAQPSDDELTMLAARLTSPSAAVLPCTAIAPGPAILEAAAANYSCWLGQLDSLLGPVPRISKEFQGFARVDWQATDRQHLSVEANVASLDAPAGAISRSSETYGSHSFGNSQASDLWGMARIDSFLTPNLLNSAAALYRRHAQSDTPQTPSTFEAPLLAGNSLGQLPEIVADSRYGFILGKPARLGKSRFPDEQAYVAQETLSWVRGAHLVKLGASFDHFSDAVGMIANQTGTYSYTDVLNFISDTASVLQYGLDGVDNPTVSSYHNCDRTGRIYDHGQGGRGFLPCYAWYSQRIGPSNWHLSTNDLAAFATEQWQPYHGLTVSAGVRVEAEQLPPPITAVANPDLPATQKFPGTALNWAPRFGVAWSPFSKTVLRMGAGLYYGRIDNSVVLAALTQTGSLNGDLNFFFKPTDVGAPPFPYVFSGEPQTAVVPGAVSFAPRFRSQEVDQAVVSLEQELPSHWLVSVSAQASLGRRLPISVDANLQQETDPITQKPQTVTYDVVDTEHLGPIHSAQITVPLYTARVDSSYQQLAFIESRANSTYDAALFKIVRYGSHGLSLRAHYLYAHATDWNPNESGNVAVNDVLDPANFGLEYGTSNLDIRHSAGATVLYQTPWKRHDWAGYFANGWRIAAVGHYRSGLPFTMRTSGYIPGFSRPLLAGGFAPLDGVAPGMNASGGDNRVYGLGSDGIFYNMGRNTFRYPATWGADARIAKRFEFAHRRELELLAESFNLFNHQNVTRIETTGYTIYRGDTKGSNPTLNFLNGLTRKGLPSTIPEFGKPLDVNATNFYRPREFQFGLRARF